MRKLFKINMLCLPSIFLLLAIANNHTAQACCPANNPNTEPTDISTGGTVGDPIGIIDGKVLLEEKDLVLQTPILGLEFIRAWRTPGASSSVLGGGWEHNFEWKVLTDAEAGITPGTNTYQGVTGEYKVVKIPVNPYDGAFKGGKYFFVKESNNYYKCVGQELSGATLQQMANGTWKLAGLSGNSVSYLFNSNGYLTQITHPSSVNITLSYNSANRLTNIAHSCGTSLNLLYSGNSLVQVRNNRDTNLWMQYSYADISGAYNNLFTATRHVSSSSSDNQVFKYYYESLTNANGISQSVIARKTNPIGDQYLWRYQTNYSLMADGAWVVSGGITNYGTTLTRSTNTLNTQMSVDVTTDRFGSASCSTYIYDLIKVVPTNIIGPLPYQFEDRAYDNQNNLTERCFSLNGDEALFGSNYDTNHNVIGLYSSYNSGSTMYLDYSLTWTTNRLLSEISDSLNRGYQFQYGSHDLPIQILAIDENNYTRSLAKFSYNSEGLPLRYTNANNHVTAYTYSTTSDGKNVTVQPPLGSSKTIKFDHLWRPTQFTERDSSGNYRTTYFQTDFAGRPLTITNPSNQVTSFQYDKAGRLIRAEDPSGRFITNEWRLGKLVSQTIGKTGSSISANISLEYDPQMTMVSVKDPMNRYVETYELDDAGQVTNVTTLDGRSLDIYRGVQDKIYQIDRYKSNAQYENSISIGYNTKGKVSSVSYPNHDSQVPYYDYHTYSYGYLSNGLLSSIVGDNNTIGLSYDSWNNLVQVRNDMENEWFSATNSFSYDAEGNLTNKVLTFTDYIDNYPLVEATYLYDANERLIGENDLSGNPRWRYAYNAYSGKLAYATNMVSGIYCKYTYDALGRITEMMYNKSIRGWIPYYINYRYDNSGRISSKDCYGGGQGVVGYTAYTYDQLGRLASETGYGVATNEYSYDLAGNRTYVYGTSTASYSTQTNNNRLVSWGSNGSMTYSDAGCVTSLARNTKPNITSLNLSWNGEYQLMQVDVSTPSNIGNSIYYTYDSLGRKLSRSDNDTWEYYIYDGMNLVADYDAINGKITRTYSYGPGVDNIQSMTVYDENNDSTTYYYIKDASNTVHALVDGTGLIVEYYYYDAFGNVKMRDEDYQWMTESKCDNRFLFQGREYDYDTALYYFRARWYEPETGRWLSPDPIGISGGLNLYAFCGNDPVNYIDPEGKGGVQFGDWFLGWGNPWLVFDDSTLDTMWNGGAAAIDGMIPWFDPFDTFCDAYKNECGEYDSSYGGSYNIGIVAGTIIDVSLGYKYKWYPAATAGINIGARLNDSRNKFKK